jgi:hypothetical protein
MNRQVASLVMVQSSTFRLLKLELGSGHRVLELE